MKYQSNDSQGLAEEIRVTEDRLQRLEREVGEIPGPGSRDLRKRLQALQVEERALKRNFSHLFDRNVPKATETERRRKVESLVHHIEDQEEALEHEAHFLHQGAPTSVTFAVRCGARLLDRGTRKIRETLGDKLWFSPFVNNTHETLSRRFGQSGSKEG